MICTPVFIWAPNIVYSNSKKSTICQIFQLMYLQNRGEKPNALTLWIECSSILEAAQDQPVACQKLGRGVRRHVLHFYSFFKHFLPQRSLGSTVLHFGPHLFPFNIQAVQNCCKFKSDRVTKYHKGSVCSKENKPPPDFVFYQLQTQKKCFTQIIS